MVDQPEYAHCYRLRDEQGRVFLDHGGIWLLELSKFAADGVQTEQQRWLRFFNEAERLDEGALPAWMQTQEMRQAMSTLKVFSEKERAYHSYQARQNYLREQSSVQRHLDDLNAQLETLRAVQEKERAVMERERAAKEQERTEKEHERAAKEQERAAKEKERAAKEDALAEIERLKRLLGEERS